MNKELLTYQQLIKSLKDCDPTYEQLLNTVEWKNFRIDVITKDQSKCTVCGTKKSEKIGKLHVRNFTPQEKEQQRLLDQIEYELKEPDLIVDGEEIKLMISSRVGEILKKPLYLHAHHNFYVFGNLPWEYKVSDLRTMCENCHSKYHKENKVPYYSDSSMLKELDLIPCIRCSAAGFFNEYTHVEGGICFRCRGAKYEELIGKGIY